MEDRIQKFDVMMGGIITQPFTDWLIQFGFFTAPASTKYHGAYEGGLFDHSYAVAETLRSLTKVNRLKWLSPRSPLVVGMFHDLCKIDNYVKTETGYDYNKAAAIAGHGSKSIIYLAPHLRLTEEEILCIYHHMGAFDDKENWNYYSEAIKRFPNVLWTHTADMIASKIIGI